jgi:4-hydroxy-2-oxoheptanedioate aldolase
MVEAGFDWLLIDLEHAPIGFERLEAILMTFKNTDVVPIARVAWGDLGSTKQVMDLGVEALLIPMVNSREDATRAVSLCRYPPAGVRGVSPRRASAQGEFDRYLQEANDRVMVLVQIEHIAAVPHAEAIMTTPGVEGIIIGKIDLTASMGLMPHWNDAKVAEVVDQITAIARRVKCPFGLAAPSEESATEWAARGAQMIWVTGDLDYMQAGAVASVGAFRDGLKRRGLA